ncbi:Protein RecA [uncultured archaeon]|nr:Protein RecA [uncultured archaeon]
MAIKKKGKAKEDEKPGVDPRTWSAEQRRELFLARQKELKEQNAADWKVLKSDLQEVTVPWGYIIYDNVLRLRQIPRRGRVVQIHGDEGAGKSTTAYGITSNYIRETGEGAAIYDFERTSEWDYLTKIGIPKDMCEVFMPLGIAQASKRMLEQLKAGVRFFVLDSIQRMKNRVDEKEILSGAVYKDTQPGQHAKQMTRFWDTMLDYFAEYDATVIAVNQTRARIEQSNDARLAAKYPTFTNLPYILPGGKLTRFVMSVMIELQRKKAYRSGELVDDDPFILEPNPLGGKEKGDFIATASRVRVIKNKINDGGFREGLQFMRPGIGVDDLAALRYLARQYGLIASAGKKWYVGDKENPLITYNDQAKAVQDLVIDQNVDILKALRPLVEKAVEEDQSTFISNIDIAEKAYLEGEIDMDDIDAVSGPSSTSKKFEMEVEEV